MAYKLNEKNVRLGREKWGFPRSKEQSQHAIREPIGKEGTGKRGENKREVWS